MGRTEGRSHRGFAATTFAAFIAISIDTPVVRAGPGANAQPSVPPETFRDCPEDCPEMVVIPSGTFTMGTSPDRREGLTQELKTFFQNEGPVRTITIKNPIAVGIHEVTWAEWEKCVDAGGCDGAAPEAAGGDNGWGKGNRPVIEVSWHHAQTYLGWLSAKTGYRYRLLTEAEWEYAASAGSDTYFSWGDEAGEARANCSGCGSEWDNRETAPVGSFEPNAFGLYDMHGNVREWVEDCWAERYDVQPVDGSAYTKPDCMLRVVRGGAWNLPPVYVRLKARDCYHPDDQLNTVGFRIARTIAAEQD